MKITKPEILSPAGNFISLAAAIQAGCDAVYFGVKGWNMRAGAANFSVSQIKRIVKNCHSRGVKAYLALNTIVFDTELPKIKRIITAAKDAGVDAVICWDMAVMKMVSEAGIPVHVSTQMSVSNAEGIDFLHKQFGISRIVLARECSLEDIKRIGRKIKNVVELEVFAHGAMCLTISGRCLLSHSIYGKSANRGECLQPCRRQYRIAEPDEGYSLLVERQHVLSPLDLCTLPFIEKLLQSPISSLKIEGRNRSPEYVSIATSAYRRAVDFYFDSRGKPVFDKSFKKLKASLMQELDRVYNRGFSSGFFLGKPVNQWTEVPGNHSPFRKEYIGIVTNYFKKHNAAEITVESRGFSTGEELMFQGTTTGVFTQKADSIEIDCVKVEKARKGSKVSLKTDRVVRRKDKLYAVVEQKC